MEFHPQTGRQLELYIEQIFKNAYKLQMPDKYENYKQLSSNMVEGDDYRIRQKNRKSTVCVLAPHGGKIERGTSELAEAIAGHHFNFYAFEGLRKSGNRDLHITSHKFDEPKGLEIASMSQTVLGIHGRMDREDPENVYLGGKDKTLMHKLADKFSEIGISTKVNGHSFRAEHHSNICNRGKSGMGVQLEISKSMRERLLTSNPYLIIFADAVRNVLE